MIDGVLMTGFGGPTPGCCGRRAVCPKTAGCEAECFVAGILGDNPARVGRVAEVAQHYQEMGGYSPYNQLTGQQARALSAVLAHRGRPLPVVCGYRHWTPWAVDGLRALTAQGCRNLALLIMAPHQSTVSWDWYVKHAAEALETLEKSREIVPTISAVIAPWWNAHGYIDAIVAELRAVTLDWSAERLAAAALIFTAHAIPQPVEQTSPYRRQFAETAQLAAAAFGHPAHAIAFQSQPSDSRIPWSAPTISSAIRAAHAAGAKDVLLQAAGFLVDHTEVLFDLDHEAKDEAEQLGLIYTRARCVHSQPAFIELLAERVLAADHASA